MANPSRKKRKRKASVVGAVLKLLFLLLLLSMLAAYIANQVALSSKKAELDTLQEQIEQQKTQNEEMQRILSGDSDDVTEWVARDSYNYAAANERRANQDQGEQIPDAGHRLIRAVHQWGAPSLRSMTNPS